MNNEWLWYSNYPLPAFPERFHVEIIDGVKYILDRIPDDGLWGTYCGQGDLRWAWVRLDTWTIWAKPSVVAEVRRKWQ